MKKYTQIGAILGAICVGIGAFGAHGLKKMLEANGTGDTFETATKYLFYHALALVLLGFFQPSKYANRSGISFIAGIIIFSGSLYIICFTGIKTFGAVAPLGGVLLILGWVFLFLASKSKHI